MLNTGWKVLPVTGNFWGLSSKFLALEVFVAGGGDGVLIPAGV